MIEGRAHVKLTDTNDVDWTVWGELAYNDGPGTQGKGWA
jgi:hypothetical protein